MKMGRDLCLAALAMTVFVLLVELSLRFAAVRYESSVYRLDADLGYVLRPGARGWSVKEREHYEYISEQGLWDRIHSLKRPADTIRIAVVGDSFSEAKQIDEVNAWWAVMEQALNRRLAAEHRRVEVINFGVAGYGLPQEFVVIQKKVWQYDPQIVLLTGTLHSLVLDTSRKYSSVQVGGGPIPYFVHTDHGLVLDAETQRERREFVPPGPFSDFLGDLTNASRVMSALNVLRRTVSVDVARFQKRLHQSAAEDPSPASAASAPLGWEDTVLRGPSDPEFGEAYLRAEELICLSRDEVVKHNAEFWFVLLDMSPQVDPEESRRTALAHALNVDNLYLADRAFDDFAAHEGINRILTAADLLAVAQREHRALHGFPNRPPNSGHWNEFGHAAAGELLARRLWDSSPRLRTLQ
jgi:hypothetical protein